MMNYLEEEEAHRAKTREEPQQSGKKRGCGCLTVVLIGLDHGVGHFRPLSITRQRHVLAYHFIAMRHEGLCQVF